MAFHANKHRRPAFNLQLTAGVSLLEQVPTARPDQLVGEVRNTVCEQGRSWDSVNYIYVTDEKKRLVGVCSIKELIVAPKEKELKDIMTKKIISVHPGSHVARVAALAVSNNLKSVPVLDPNGRFLGIVGADSILRALHQSHVETLLRFAGVKKNQIIGAKSSVQIRSRLPWLIVGLLGGMLATVIVGFFEATLSQELALAFFIPIVVYMSDAIGTQTETLLIRALAIEKIRLKKYLFREIATGGIIGMVCGLLLGGSVYIFYKNIELAITIGASLFAAMTVAAVIGLITPVLLIKMKKDPAFGSGPLGTILSDIISLIIYFGVATAILF